MLTRFLGLLFGLLALVVAAPAAEPMKPYAQQPAQMAVRRSGIPNVLAKLDAGKDVKIAYFGGSITAQPGWRVKTFDWFRKTWPAAKLTEINATIGGTNSEHGVYRCWQDVLSKKPDLVFVEFAVNDGGMAANDCFRGMEGIVRQTLIADPAIDICFVYTFRTGYEKDLEKGLNPPAASAHEMVAAWYDIPSINVALKTVQLAQEGKLIYVPKVVGGEKQPTPDGVILFSDDGVHPHIEGGHVVYTQVLIEALTAWRQGAKAEEHSLRSPLIADNWDAAKLVPLRASMLGGEWTKMPPTEGLARNFVDRLPELWHTAKPGSTITFRVKGQTVKLYDLLGPDGGQVDIEVDGRKSGPVGRFDSYCTYYRLANLFIARDLGPGEHTIKVTLRADQPSRASVTDREKDKPGFDPKKYDGTNLWIGSIMVIGDVLD
ncbi:MAG: SGNH/GDSL hydrolase family protein [Armatimonadetes bacterium]|nr:SGNH/GDSL hydrolase family protein [Armatimonadota bacterium]